MKKSLIWRFAVILAILAAWIYSMFPLQDRNFFTVFRDMARDKLSTYENNVEEYEKKLAKTKESLKSLENESSAQYQELTEKKDTLSDKLQKNKQLLQQFDELLKEAHTLLASDDSVKAPYKAVEQAAQGRTTKEQVQLNKYITLPTNATPSNSMVISRVRQKSKGTMRLGLDLRGGTEFVLGFEADEISKEEDTEEGKDQDKDEEVRAPDQDPEEIRDQIINIIKNRVNNLGLAHAQVKPIGPTTISLRMPSVTASEKADVRRTIKQTAKLTFHLVHPNNRKKVQEYMSNPDDFTIGPKYVSKPKRKETVESGGQVEYQHLFITKRPARVSGENIKRAIASFDQFGNYYVSINFNSKGAKQFGRVTAENTNRRLAIVLDGKVYSAPQINEPIRGGRAQITGNFSSQEANRLATVIESGNLPVSIQIDSEFSIDPTLGKDSIRSGATATVIGLLAVVIFMVFYYRFAGVVAVSAVFANIFLVFGTLALTGATITLPGIAGIVLVIGMAVDANVLIFERIREEQNNGKSISNALHAGYRRAFTTILDANLTTLITAVILMRIGSGPIKGFAVTLSIGVIASMFTALFMTRAIFDLTLYLGYLKKLKMLLIIKNPQYDFLKLRRVAVAVSFCLIVISLGWAGIRGGDILSIDFAGGTAVTYTVDDNHKPEVDAVRSLLQQKQLSNVNVGYKYAAGSQKSILEVIIPEGKAEEVESDFSATEFGGLLQKEFPQSNCELAQTNSVGSLVGERFRNKAIWACVMAAIAIIIYISFRFEFAYGVGAVAALVHDVIIATGIYLLCGRQLSLPVVAALLTIMGYSLNDTIVLFDRIRENLGLLTTKTYREIINLSINQVLSRTLLTSLTTLLVVVILFLFGGGAINNFALVIMVGVVVGTYSSVFVAGNIISAWHKPSRAEERGSSTSG